MKWINLADRQPVLGPGSVIYRIPIGEVGRGSHLVFTDSAIWPVDDDDSDILYVLQGKRFVKMPVKDIEWLDESDNTVEYMWVGEQWVPKITNLYEIQAMRVNNGEITLEEYLRICFPHKFTEGYQLVQVLPGSQIIPPPTVDLSRVMSLEERLKSINRLSQIIKENTPQGIFDRPKFK